MCSLFDPDNLWPGRTDGARVVVDQPSHFIIGSCSTRDLRRVFNQLLLFLKTASPRYLSKQSANGDYRCSPVDETMTPEDELTKAAAKGNTARVESLLRAGAQVNGVNCFGRTALQVMMMGSTSVAQVLLNHGADPNVTERSTGTTPLHDAARTGFLDTVRLLVQFLADPQARDNTNCRPIELARDSGHTDVAAFLESL